MRLVIRDTHASNSFVLVCFLLQVRAPVVFVVAVCRAALGDDRVVGLVAGAAPGDGRAVVPVAGAALGDGPSALWPERHRGMAVPSWMAVPLAPWPERRRGIAVPS